MRDRAFGGLTIRNGAVFAALAHNTRVLSGVFRHQPPVLS